MLSSSSPPEIDGLDPDAGLLAELEATRARLRRAEQARGAADHRIANRLQLAAAFLKAERRRTPHEAARLALLTAEARLHGVARLHRRVRWPDRRPDRRPGRGRAGDGPLAVPALLDDLAAGRREALGLDRAVACEPAAAPISVPGAMATQIAVAMGEPALNALEHACDGRAGGSLAIGARLRLAVADRGAGLLDGFSLLGSDGLGMGVMQAAARRMGASLSARTIGGAVFVLEIPLDGLEGQPADGASGPSSRSYSASGTP